jgi:ABC-type transport system involved in multi-copper enzyme maturation permease subunit
MQSLIAVEFFKMRKRMMTWVVTLLTIGLIILLYSILWNATRGIGTFGHGADRVSHAEVRSGLFLNVGIPFALQIIATFGTLLAVILAAGAAGSEYAWGTVRLMATASSGRLRLMTARLIVVCGLVALLVLVAVFVALAYSAIITSWYGGLDFSFVTPGFVKDQWFAFGRTLYVMAPYVGLAFAAAIIGRSTLAGVGTGLAVAFLEPFISELMRIGGEPWYSVPNYLLSSNKEVMMVQNKLPANLPSFGLPSTKQLADQGAHSPEVAALILAAYFFGFLAIAFYAYRRRDITSASGG